jgi:hypothetical protein
VIVQFNFFQKYGVLFTFFLTIITRIISYPEPPMALLRTATNELALQNQSLMKNFSFRYGSRAFSYYYSSLHEMSSYETRRGGGQICPEK